MHFGDNNKNGGKFVVEFLELEKGDSVVIGSLEHCNEIHKIGFLTFEYN